MNIGFYACIVLVPLFLIMGLLFGIFKEKSAKFISGFNSLTKEQQALYDKEKMAKDMRNSCLIWAGVLFIGGICSYFITPYFAIIAYIIWAILFFKDVHLDPEKAFEKYLLK